MKRSKYYEFKPIDSVWITEIPKNWSFIEVKRLFNIYNGSTPSSNIPEYWNGEIEWITPDDLGSNNKKHISEGNRKITFEGYNSCGAKLVPKDSIIISSRAPIGHLAIANQTMCTNQGCKSLVPRTDRPDSNYYYYLILCIKPILQVLGKGTTFQELATGVLGKLKITFPPKSEQHVIAAFLDRETARIDALIEKKQQLIALLKEKRTALITRAVTKGLNPNAKMKRSGIQWLGEIPEHWEVKRLKYVATINDEVLNENTDAECQIKYVDIGSVDKIDGIKSKEEFIFSNAPSRARRRVKDGDVIVSTVRTYLEAIAPIVEPEENLIVSTGFAVVRPKGLFKDYLSFALRSDYFIAKVVSISTGVSYPAISSTDLAMIDIAIPPDYSEQNEISKYLHGEIFRFNKIDKITHEAIEKLREYRAALISAAVTGKIKVITD